MKQYHDYLRDILENGIRKGDRTGTGTISRFGHQLRFDLQEGFPLVTTKYVPFRLLAEEMLWFLRGETNIRPLVEKHISIWTDWPFQRWARENDLAYTLQDRNDRWKTESEFYQEKKRDFEELIVSDKEFARLWGDLGPVYGSQWRSFLTPRKVHLANENDGTTYLDASWLDPVDQIKNLIEGLRNNPDSRRHLVSAWHPGLVDKQALPPCHYAFQCWTRKLTVEERWEIMHEAWPDVIPYNQPLQINNEADRHEWHLVLDHDQCPRRGLSLQLQLRSSDTFLGFPFNAGQYSLLTHLLADHLGMMPDELIISVGDGHIYLNHLDQVETLLSREPRPLPTLEITRTPATIDKYTIDDFELHDYTPYPRIKAPVAV